ncbi:hypothetical protein Hanom_Chr00s189794g01834471 [Helianthus anomalus]
MKTLESWTQHMAMSIKKVMHDERRTLQSFVKINFLYIKEKDFSVKHPNLPYHFLFPTFPNFSFVTSMSVSE